MLYRDKMHYQVFIVLMIISSCTSSIEIICKKVVDITDMAVNVTCTCDKIVKDFQVFDTYNYFINATHITITNCRRVNIAGNDLESRVLKSLRLYHIQNVSLDGFLPSNVLSVEIEDVNNLNELNRLIFSHKWYLDRLVIKNTTVMLVSSDTFSDLTMKDILLENVTFKSLEPRALNFTSNEDSNINSKICIKNCIFEKLGSDSIFLNKMRVVKIMNSEFNGVLNNKTFKITSTPNSAVYFKSNKLTCSDGATTCDGKTLQTVENLRTSIKQKHQTLCEFLQTNFCKDQQSNSLLKSMRNSEYCVPYLLKQEINAVCTTPDSGKGHNAYLNMSLSIACVLILRMFL